MRIVIHKKQYKNIGSNYHFLQGIGALEFLGFLSPVIALPVSIYGMTKRSWNWKVYSALFAVFFAAIAYNFNYINPNDLTRYFDQIIAMQGQSLLYVFQHDKEFLFANDILFWLISRIGDVHLLPFITTFFAYYTAAYICGYFIYKYQREDIAFLELAIIACALELNIIINYVRNVLCFALIILAAFHIIVEKKKIFPNIVLMIVGMFMHTTGIILILGVLLAGLIKKINKFAIFLAAIVGNVVSIIYAHISVFTGNKILEFIGQTIRKANAYFTNNVARQWASIVANSRRYRIIKIYDLILVVLILVYYIYIRRNEESDKRDDYFANFIIYIGLIALGCFPIVTPAYNRFYSAFIIGQAALLIPKFKRNSLFFYLIVFYSLFGAVFWIGYIYTNTYHLHYMALPYTNIFYFIINAIFGY